MTRIIPILLSLLLLIACTPAQQHAIGSLLANAAIRTTTPPSMGN